MTITHALYVEVSASTPETVAHMVEALARAACDVANSMEDDAAHIQVWDNDRGEQSHLPVSPK
jgi:hypothetical protein